MAMTNEEYVKKEGIKCPFCFQVSVEVLDDLDQDGAKATQNAACHNPSCGAKWVDEWKLVGYDYANPDVPE